MTELRAVDEPCSTLGINGASVGSVDIAAGVSACDEADRVGYVIWDLLVPLNHLELTQTLHLKGHVTYHH